MKFYHISLDTKSSVNKFIPRVPTATYEEENKEIPRICLSTSIEGCLSAVPWGGRKLEYIKSSMSDHIIDILADEYEEGFILIFRVYEFTLNQIQKENILYPDELTEKGFVMDADNSDEVWIVNQNLTPESSYLAVLGYYDEELKDVFSKEFYSLSEEEVEEIDYIEDFITGASTRISNAELKTYKNKEDLPIKVDWKTWKEKISMLEEENYDYI